MSGFIKGPTMKKAAGILAGLLVVATPIVVLNLGASVPIDELRAARVPCDKVLEEDCPAGVIRNSKFCICLTNKETVTDETTNISAADKRRLVICEVTDEESGKPVVVSRYESTFAAVSGNCRLVADNVRLPGISMHNVETGIEDKLRAACAPCKIESDSWGPCPRCLWDNSCAEKCP